MARPLSPMALAALLAVYVFWGSTFAGMRLAGETIPPFVLSSVRFAIAGAILYAVALLRGQGKPSRSELGVASVTGITLLVFGNGVTSWCVQILPTGIASLLVSLAPLWMVGFDYLLSRARTTWLAGGGMALGLAGLGLLVSPKVEGRLDPLATAVILAGSVSWAFGSVYARRDAGRRMLLTLALQMLIGSAVLALLALALGEWHALRPAAVTPLSLAGLAWLIVFGSLVGYSAYFYLMQHAPTTLASTYAYVNPIVAVILGVWLFHERVTPWTGVAAAIILAGVALMMLPPGILRRRRATAVAPQST